ncbi:hypothetical protein HPT27_07780 [Permianibacter sp. IMCC34836]|uniref:hypothetical protein n=1 Tax=Permianibacter fluminis TaxID=2738515 RepID=UPI001556EF46|nr:hypothetical protein [Permianibacter fluminis]NQD36923.1 hypothetical protein [Permianibacter fluminis]
MVRTPPHSTQDVLIANRWRPSLSLPMLFSATMLLAAATARAEVGVSVLANYRFGDDLAVNGTPVSIDEGNSAALTLHYFNTASSAFDLWFSRFDTDAQTGTVMTAMRQDSIQFGGRKYWQDQPFLPYVGATIGIQRLSPDLAQRERETRPAFSLFTGLALPLTEDWQLLAEARWLGTVFSSETTVRCDDSDCEWKIKSGTWTQYEVGIGLTARF